jgi:hypothetical protein
MHGLQVEALFHFGEGCIPDVQHHHEGTEGVWLPACTLAAESAIGTFTRATPARTHVAASGQRLARHSADKVTLCFPVPKASVIHFLVDNKLTRGKV